MTRKTIISTIVFVSLILAGSTLHAGSKIDPFFDVIPHIQNQGKTRTKALSLSKNPSQVEMVGIFVKTKDMDATISLITSIGGAVRAIISSDLLTANVPMNTLEKLEADSSVVFIEADKPVQTKNDVAMVELNGNEVHDGMDLPTGYTGSGVIIGIIDTGVDLTHQDFLDQNGNSRIIYAWDQQASGSAGPEELFQTYGVECDSKMIENGACPMNDSKGHGTHITGTAAGSDDQYGGVAPDADIIAVRYRQELIIDGYATPVFSTTICEAAYYVFKKAEELGRPAVVNMSLGTHIGAHDGTSLFEQCLDALVEGSTGRAIVAAAGNEHIDHSLFTGIHAGYNVEGKAKTNFRIRSLSDGRIFYLDAWMGEGSDLAFGLTVRDSASSGLIGSTEMVAPGKQANGTLADGKITWRINAEETTSPLNGKPHVGITIVLDNSITNPLDYDFDLKVSGAGSFNAWWYPDKSSSLVAFTSTEGTDSDGFKYMPGDDKMNVAIPSTARNVIAVGGYASRTDWDKGGGCCQVAFTLSDLLPFSSIGPSADPSFTGQKPEIIAPGAMIASTRSHDAPEDLLLDLPDGEHTMGAGTSMATPFVSGTAALIFSADENFTFEDVRSYITSSAYADEFTGNVPNNRWGYGKLDVLAAIQTAVLGGPTGNSSANTSLALPEATSGGSSSCSMMPGQSFGMHVVPALLSVFSMAAVIWSTRRRKEEEEE